MFYNRIINMIKILKRISPKAILTADLVLAALIFGVLFNAYANQELNFSGPEPEAMASVIYDNCFKERKAGCYKKEFTEITKDEGLVFATKTLYAMQDLDPPIRHCHVLAHEMARVETLKNPSEWKGLLDKVDLSQCGGGFFHGVLEAHIGSEPDFKITTETIKEICIGERTNEKDFRVRTCVHILGHLTMIETLGQIEPALPICAGLPDVLAYNCYNGVFMEDSFKTSLAVHGLAELPVRDKPRLERQRARCFNYKDMPASACWTDMAEIFIEFHNYDAAITYKLCNEAPEELSRTNCYKKAVTLMPLSPSYDKVEKLVAPCKPFLKEDEKYSQCYRNMISGLLFYSPKFTDRAVTLCSNIPEHHKDGCFKRIGALLQVNISSLSDREILCKDAPDEFKRLCSAG